MSIPPDTPVPDMDDAWAQEAVRSFLDMARKHASDDELAVALISTGAALMASTRGVEPAIEALRDAMRELRKSSKLR